MAPGAPDLSPSDRATGPLVTAGTGPAAGRGADGRLVSLHAHPALDGTVQERPADGHTAPPPSTLAHAPVARLPVVVYLAVPAALWRPLEVSPQIRDLTGFTAAEWVEDPELWVAQAHPRDRERLLLDRLQAAEHDGRMRCEYRLRHRGGAVRWVHDEVVIQEVEGRPLAHGVLVDTTRRRQCGDLLEELYESARSDARTVRSADEARRTFLRMFVHDVRRPLEEALHRAEGVLPAFGPDQETQRRELESVVGHLVRTNDILADVLDLERLDVEEMTLRPRATDLGDLVRTVVARLDPGDRRVEVEAAGTATVDPLVAQQALGKLLENAVHHTPPGTIICVRGTDRGDGVLLTVEDDGPGVPEDVRDQIFHPFSRGIAPTSRPGLGLGLAVVARLARLHGGQAWADERSGGGAAFHLHLPAEPDPGAA